MNKFDIISSIWFRIIRKLLWKNKLMRIATKGVGDKTYAKINYWWHTLRFLDLENPKLFTEKLQWMNLNYRDKIYSICSDKYEVREYLENIIEKTGIELKLIKLFNVYDNVEQIDFEKLPKASVFKANHGSGWNLLINDKSEIDERDKIKTLNSWLNDNYYYKNREYQYKNINPKIVCEEFLKNDDGSEILDYKFMCFDGEVKMVWIDYDRHTKHVRNYYNIDGEPLGYISDVPANYSIPFIKPPNYEKMVEIAEVLSKPFKHVRIDLYNINGTIYFGEMTFLSWGGFVVFETPELDTIWGDMMSIN